MALTQAQHLISKAASQGSTGLQRAVTTKTDHLENQALCRSATEMASSDDRVDWKSSVPTESASDASPRIKNAGMRDYLQQRQQQQQQAQ